MGPTYRPKWSECYLGLAWIKQLQWLAPHLTILPFSTSIHLQQPVLTTMNRRHTFDALNTRPTHPPRSSSTSSSAALLRPEKSKSRRDKNGSSSGKEANKKPSRHADVIDTWDPTGLGSASEYRCDTSPPPPSHATHR